MQWKAGWVLWCQRPLIKCAWGWKRNVCMVFALCPPQATVLPEALCIFLTLPPHTLWLQSYPQPASTSDPRAKRPSIIFLSLHFCSRGYFWHLNLLTLRSAKKVNIALCHNIFVRPRGRRWQQGPGIHLRTTCQNKHSRQEFATRRTESETGRSLNHTSAPILDIKEDRRADTRDFGQKVK